jgi:hypothetical protein
MDIELFLKRHSDYNSGAAKNYEIVFGKIDYY